MMINILFGLLFVALMFVAIGHVYIAHKKIFEGYADSPWDREARFNSFVAAGCLFLAFLLPSPTYADTTQDIETKLTSTFDSLLTQLPTLETEQDAKDFIRRQIIPLTDTQTTARLMLGKHWRRAKDHQRNAFVDAMTDNLINTYSAFLLDPDADRAKFNIIRVTEKEIKKKGKVVGYKYSVVATVTIDQSVDVGFSISQRGSSSWKIYDVKVEGISMVQNWRSTFNELLRNQSLDSLIEDIRNNNVKPKE